MPLQTLCTPRSSVFTADRRATVLSLDTFLKGQVDGPDFFAENFFTNDMLTLVDRAFRHLGGSGAGSSVFMLSQAMGGGKTHSMVALGLLARDPELRKKVLGDQANGTRMHTPSGFAAAGLAQASEGNTKTLPARRGRAATGATHPFASSPLRHLLFAIRETTATDNSPEPGGHYLHDTFGQGYWALRERFVGLLEWIADSEAARMLAVRLRNDCA